MSGEAEPRRSVRATKGQHTKSFDEIEPAAMPKRRQTKKTKKALEQEQEQSQEPEEVIRCICGATEQDEDSGEAWISCETCFAWQHNVCVGVSSFEDEIPEYYWCEQCRPQDHKELLDGIAKGEKPWEARRKTHEEEAEKKKRKGGRKAKGKRLSDGKDDGDKDSARGSSKPKASPTPDAASKDKEKEKDKKEPAAKQGKRKSREDSHDTDGKTPKMRRVSENEGVAVPSSYTVPDDLATAIKDLPTARVGPGMALKRSLAHVISQMVKSGDMTVPEGGTNDTMAETYALQIERAVCDTHPARKGLKEYGQQIKSLSFNLKNNPELFQGLVEGQQSPSTLAIMTSDEMASSEMQRQTAEMKAKAEKQSILYTQDTGPRVRRTHKGEEVVEDESLINSEAPLPSAGGPRRGAAGDQHGNLVKRESVGGDQSILTGRSPSIGGDGGQHSPSQSNFDITKVFSSVKSPTGGHIRRPSAPVLQTNGPGFDPDVDRMLQDDNESPPYSPTEDFQDPEVVWRGSLAMSSIADFQATAKYIGGANFASLGSWSELIPRQMSVAGRITEQSAVEYLCGLRYSNLTDIIVVNLTPVSPSARPEFNNLIDYFVGKNRYGVVGNKVAGNVRDTYLVPVPAGKNGHPEFMLNLVDNYIPTERSEPMLLAVFVYRNDPDQVKRASVASGASTTATPGPQQSPTPPVSAASGHGQQRSNSMSAPTFSPATPQGAFAPPPYNGSAQSTTPVPIPQPPHSSRPPSSGSAVPPPMQGKAQAPGQTQPQPAMTEAQMHQAQQAGQAVAQELLGPHASTPSALFLLPNAYQMHPREWETIRSIFDRDPRAREDLPYLGAVIEKEGKEKEAKSVAAATAAAGTAGAANTAA